MAKYSAEAKHGKFVADRAIDAVRKCQAAYEGAKPTGIAIYEVSNGDGEGKRHLCGLTSTEAKFQSRRPIGKEEKAMAKSKAKAVKAAKKVAAKKEKAPSKDKALLFGHPVTSVARALGAANWSPSDAIKAITKLFPSVSPATIRTQVQAGKAGKRGDPAKLENGDLKSLQEALA